MDSLIDPNLLSTVRSAITKLPDDFLQLSPLRRVVVVGGALSVVSLTWLFYRIRKHLTGVSWIPGLSFSEMRKVTNLSESLHRFLVENGWPRVVRGNWITGPTVFVTNADVAQHVLNSADEFVKGPAIPTFPFNRLVANSVLFVPNDDWRRQRMALNPHFHPDSLQRLFGLFKEKTAILMKKWSDIVENDHGGDFVDLEVTKWTSAITLDILGITTLDYDFDLLNGANKDLYAAYNYVFGVTATPKYQLYLLRRWFPFSVTKKGYEASDLLSDFVDNLIEERKREISAGRRTGRLIDLMLLSKKLTHEEIKHNIFIFMIAGHDTTAIALVFHMRLLAEHRELQGRIRAEIVKVLGDREPTWDDLQGEKLPLLERFIKESLRIYPPAANVRTRVAAYDTELDGYRVPKGTHISLHVYSIHHNPEFWPNPEKFDPDRFLPENSKDRHPFAYLPFSMLGHNCIGNNFSLIEQRMFLVSVLRRFDFLEAKELRLHSANPSFLRPEHSVMRMRKIGMH